MTSFVQEVYKRCTTCTREKFSNFGIRISEKTEMNNPRAIDNLKPFKPGVSGNPNGHPLGQKNRSTIARKVLEMKALFVSTAFEELQKLYPDITKQMTVEEIGAIIQADKMIREGDTNAYKALHDSAYGMPKQDIDHSTMGEKLPAPIIHIHGTPQLSSSEQDVSTD